MDSVKFLTVEEVIKIHDILIKKYGGKEGIRDYGLLESAILQPQVKFSKNYMHEDLFSMAAAYMYHLIKNHPFFDGNKRIGVFCSIIFMEVNFIVIDIKQDLLYRLALNVAQSKISKGQIADFLRKKYD